VVKTRVWSSGGVAGTTGTRGPVGEPANDSAVRGHVNPGPNARARRVARPRVEVARTRRRRIEPRSARFFCRSPIAVARPSREKARVRVVIAKVRARIVGRVIWACCPCSDDSVGSRRPKRGASLPGPWGTCRDLPVNRCQPGTRVRGAIPPYGGFLGAIVPGRAAVGQGRVIRRRRSISSDDVAGRERASS